jgi:hypothetical protein
MAAADSVEEDSVVLAEGAVVVSVGVAPVVVGNMYVKGALCHEKN